MTDYATRLFNAVDTAQRMRLSDAVHAIPNGSLRSRGGLRDDGGGVPALVPSSLRFTLTEFIAEVPGAAAKQGAYPFIHDDGATQYSILPGDALGARIDLAVVRVRHNVHDSSGFTDSGIVVLKGNPTSGIPPVVPAGCIPIREFNVSASASAGSGGVVIGTDRRLRIGVGPWVALPLASGFTLNTAAPEVCLIRGIAYYRGDIKRTAGSLPTSANTQVVAVGGIPADMRPGASMIFPAAGNSVTSPIIRAQVGSDGSLGAISGSDAQAYVSLAGISYPVG